MLSIIMAVLLAAAGSAAAGPTETVKGAVKQVFADPDGPVVKKVSPAERKADIRKVTWENASKLFRHPVPEELRLP